MSSSDWIIIPAIGENNPNVPNHQPVVVLPEWFGDHGLFYLKM